MKNINDMKDKIKASLHRQEGMEMIQFAFVFAICIGVAGAVIFVLNDTWKPGLAYVSSLSDGAYTETFDQYL